MIEWRLNNLYVHADAVVLDKHLERTDDYGEYDPDDPWQVALSRSYSSHAIDMVLICAGVLGASLVWMGWQQKKQRHSQAEIN